MKSSLYIALCGFWIMKEWKIMKNNEKDHIVNGINPENGDLTISVL